ncbi:cytoplasm protein [Apiospora phragmitis]|uniref:Cytoplasm protein n=1 Tax=Apiospora phragmitis TaxID=2905665 RepID=A0ABR1TA25_9PEZI
MADTNQLQPAASIRSAASVPPSPGLPKQPGFIPLVTVVDFHHARGPEVEKWFGVPEGTDPAAEWDWTLLPFMALSDGAHATTEDFSYFTLLKPATEDLPPTSLFGISCTRQMDASQLLNRPPEVTRSTVQKAVVVIADSPQFFGMLRERLSVVTSAWFAQREFTDCEILRRFQESLKDEKERGQLSEEDRDQYLGMSLRELVREFRWQTLVLLKCCLLQPKGSLFGPYTPLQQLDILADFGTKSYIVGSTNSLLLQQKDRYSDILINLDDDIINITSTSLRTALVLTASDRRWIDVITQEVNDTWDEKNPQRPNHMGYRGSEEYIRLQFEEYLLSLIASVKYRNYLAKHGNDAKVVLPHVEGDPSVDFGTEWVEYWAKTENYRMWNAHTDSLLFDIVEPKHPCAGGLTMEDVQRRLQQQVQDLHLDERLAAGREVLGRNAAAARDKASTMFNRFYADMETMREAQRKRAEETTKSPSAESTKSPESQASGNTAGAKVGAYPAAPVPLAEDGDSGSANPKRTRTDIRRRSTALGRRRRDSLPLDKGWVGVQGSTDTNDRGEYQRPDTQHSFSESLLDAAGSESTTSSPVSPRKPERPLLGNDSAAKGPTQAGGIDEIVAKSIVNLDAKAEEQKDNVDSKTVAPVAEKKKNEVSTAVTPVIEEQKKDEVEVKPAPPAEEQQKKDDVEVKAVPPAEEQKKDDKEVKPAPPVEEQKKNDVDSKAVPPVEEQTKDVSAI